MSTSQHEDGKSFKVTQPVPLHNRENKQNMCMLWKMRRNKIDTQKEKKRDKAEKMYEKERSLPM